MGRGEWASGNVRISRDLTLWLPYHLCLPPDHALVTLDIASRRLDQEIKQTAATTRNTYPMPTGPTEILI